MSLLEYDRMFWLYLKDNGTQLEEKKLPKLFYFCFKKIWTPIEFRSAKETSYTMSSQPEAISSLKGYFFNV